MKKFNLSVTEYAIVWSVLFAICKGITYILAMIALIKYIFWSNS